MTDTCLTLQPRLPARPAVQALKLVTAGLGACLFEVLHHLYQQTAGMAAGLLRYTATGLRSANCPFQYG